MNLGFFIFIGWQLHCNRCHKARWCGMGVALGVVCVYGESLPAMGRQGLICVVWLHKTRFLHTLVDGA